MECSNERGCAEAGFFFYDDECTDAQRFTVPEFTVVPLASEAEAKDLLDGWEAAWLGALEAKRRDFEHIRVFPAASSSVQKLLEDASQGQALLVLCGYLLVLVYIVVYFSFEHRTPPGQRWWRRLFTMSTLPPGPTVSVCALLSIILATACTFGVCALLGTVTPMRFNPLTYQILPFLTLGLGINDYFIITNHLEHVMRAEGEHLDPTSIMGKVVAHAGAAITMSSLANAVAFGLGAISHIPAVRDFSLQVGISVLANYLMALFALPALLQMDVHRVKLGHDDPLVWLAKNTVGRLFCCVRGAAATRGPEFREDPEEAKGARAPAWWEPLVLSTGARSCIIVAFFAFTGVCGWGASRVRVGLRTSEITQDGTALQRYAAETEKNFRTTPVTLYTKALDYADPEVLAEIRRAQYATVYDVSYVDKAYTESSWLSHYLDWVEGLQCSGNLCPEDADFVYDPFKGDEDVCADQPDRPCADVCRDYCNQDPDPASGRRCELSTTAGRTACHCPWRAVYRRDLFDAILPEFLGGSSLGEVAKSFLAVGEGEGNGTLTIEGATSVVFFEGLDDFADDVAAIKETRRVLDAFEGIGMFAYDDATFGLSEQYLHIQKDLLVAIAACLGAALVIMTPLIVHPIAAVIVMVVLVTVEIQLYGCLYFANMRLNAVTLVNMIVAVGFGVEFCAHFTRSFMLAEGSRDERIVRAYRAITPPILNGGLTTFLSILPIAFSEYGYFVKYFFAYYSLLIVLCLGNSLVLLPCILSIVGPPAYAQRREEGREGKATQSSGEFSDYPSGDDGLGPGAERGGDDFDGGSSFAGDDFDISSTRATVGTTRGC